jgi:hypothetical protein
MTRVMPAASWATGVDTRVTGEDRPMFDGGDSFR